MFIIKHLKLYQAFSLIFPFKFSIKFVLNISTLIYSKNSIILQKITNK